MHFVNRRRGLAFGAIASVGLDGADRALDRLGRAYAERSRFVMLMAAEPFVDSLRRDPRHNDLTAKVIRSHTARVRPPRGHDKAARGFPSRKGA